MATGERVLVVAAHPDDEVLGCGGTVARHTAKGDDVHVFILAEGMTARDDARDAEAREGEINALRAAAHAAAETLGTRSPEFAGLPDNRLDSLPLLDVVKQVEAVLAALLPSVVYTHHCGDLNVDHRVVHQAVVTACRPVPGSTIQAIYAFETPSSTEWASPQKNSIFTPTRFVEITDQLDAKMRALDAYVQEMRSFPHARSKENVAAIARMRGASVGVPAAEAFMVVREVVA